MWCGGMINERETLNQLILTATVVAFLDTVSNSVLINMPLVLRLGLRGTPSLHS